MRYCEDCIHHSIVTRYDPADHDRAYDLARCGLTGEETDGEMCPCDNWEGDVDSMQAHIDGLQDELRHVEAKLDQCMESYADAKDSRDKLQAKLDAYADTHMPLPLDADGVPIRLHDKMEAADGMTFTVKSIHFTSEDWDDGSWWVNEARFDPKELRHHHERTVEDVLRELIADTRKERIVGSKVSDEQIAKYADELRELMEVER